MVRVDYDDRWQLSGLHAAILANPWMRVVVLPELGGKIWSIEYRPQAHEWLWHNPRIGAARAPFGATFDENWSGGADVAFPTCYPSHWNGWSVPDLGELWSIPWHAAFHAEEEEGVLTLSAGGRIWPVNIVRTIRMDHRRPLLTLGFEIINVGSEPYPFIMGFHPALAIAPGYHIDLPPGTVRVNEGSGVMGAIGQEYQWPILKTPLGQRDMRVIPPPSCGEFGGHFFWPKTPDLWWSVIDPKQRIGIGLVAPRDRFQGLWLWQVYGGWRGYYHLALEPWTGYPITLDKAVDAGTAQWLSPGIPYSTEIKLTCFEAVDRVTAIDWEANVHSG